MNNEGVVNIQMTSLDNGRKKICIDFALYVHCNHFGNIKGLPIHQREHHSMNAIFIYIYNERIG